MFGALLIANRGEIACRVIRTARRLGIRTVAVYSEADAAALHVRMADAAFPIGPAEATKSYLDQNALIDAARQAGADAVHPGYGFLAENAAFAEACADAGLAFVGPPPAAIRAMGSKAAAKRIMGEAGVPLVPGYHGEAQDDAVLLDAAREIGFPVLIKASAGGGGKGMRRVETEEEFGAALAGARRESAAAFGDDRMLVERFIARPRHIEIQVFADTHGNAVHLFERDCSLQRRHQKVLEEAPAPGMSADFRAAMGAAAVAAAKAVDYVGAGTVEFIVETAEDGGLESFHFMEMNTRLQVEHPVTEMITGRDLVEWQLRVAAGEPLPAKQDDLAIDGHAVEARLYAEDPARDYLPATGRLVHLDFPAEAEDCRIETGVEAGDDVTVHYDPMIAKIVVWAPDRAAALARLAAAMADCRVVGVATNRDLLARVAVHAEFTAGAVDTGFLDRNAGDVIGPGDGAEETAAALGALGLIVLTRLDAADRAGRSADPHSPWHRADGWRLNADPAMRFDFSLGQDRLPVDVTNRADHFRIALPSGDVAARIDSVDFNGRALDLDVGLDGTRVRATVVRDGRDVVVFMPRSTHRLSRPDPFAASGAAGAGAGEIVAPMPGKVIEVLVAEGDAVAAGHPLLVLEAMKMEHTLTAPAPGRVAAIHWQAGAQVTEGAELIALEPEATDSAP